MPVKDFADGTVVWQVWSTVALLGKLCRVHGAQLHAVEKKLYGAAFALTFDYGL
jgi:hypothetical protein